MSKGNALRGIAAISFIAVLSLVIAMACGSKSSPTNPYNNNPPPGGGGGGGNTAHSHSIGIAYVAFSPAALTIARGDTVVWTNDDAINHTVTSNTGTALQSGPIASGMTYRHVFATAGVYDYHCSIHTTMHGVVTVQQTNAATKYNGAADNFAASFFYQ